MSIIFWSHLIFTAPVAAYTIEKNFSAIDKDQSELLLMISEEKKRLKKIEDEKIRKIESNRLLLAGKDRAHESAMELSLAIATKQRTKLQRQELDKLLAKQQKIRQQRIDEVKQEKVRQSTARIDLSEQQVLVQQEDEVAERQLAITAEQRKELQKHELDKLRKEQQKIQRQRVTEVKRGESRGLTVHIDLSQQGMSVYRRGLLLYKWRVSTAKKGYVTPTGIYRPKYLRKMHYSQRYHKSPMSHSIFYSGNFAIHGTKSVSRLGRRASHGCVRLHPKNARKLYSLVQKYGKKNTVIKITR